MCKADTQSPILIAHGTSQDQGSSKELTTKVLVAARAEGRQCLDIGGPGSVESALKLTSARPSQSMHDIDLPTDIFAMYAGGAILGTGFSENVEEIVERVLGLGKQGCIRLQMVGFSRGAVSLCEAAARLGELREKYPKLKIPDIVLSAYDPVPGPVFVPKSIKIPKSVVSSFNLLCSKHEGRPGFDQLGLAYDGADFQGDVVVGVHGDIGGSTGSALSRLITSRQLADLGLGGPNHLSLIDRNFEALDSILFSEEYTDKIKFRTRTFESDGTGSTWQPHDRADLELPMNGILGDLRGNPLGRLLIGQVPVDLDEGHLPELTRAFARLTEPQAERFQWMMEERARAPKTLMWNPRQLRTPERRIVMPPPRRVVLPRMPAPNLAIVRIAASAATKGRIK